MAESRPLGDDPELEILKAKISKLQAEISVYEDFDDVQKSDLSYDNIVEIMKNQIESCKVEFQYETELNQILEEKNEKFSTYIQEEEHIIKCTEQYLEKKAKLNESKLDERKELFFKLELLQRKLVILIKKFTKRYFPPSQAQVLPSNDLFDDANEENLPKKSLLDILGALIVEISGEDTGQNPRILHVDNTVRQDYINFLVCTNIIQRCPEDPNWVQLKINSMQG